LHVLDYPPISLSLCDLASAASAPKALIELVAREGFRFIQLDATQPELRPRQLDRSARRDLAAMLRRLDLALTGLDLFIPPSHFASGEHADRAVAAVTGAIDLAADLRELGVGGDTSSTCAQGVSLVLPESPPDDALAQLRATAARREVRLANHRVGAQPIGDEIGLGIDPAVVLLSGADPAKAASRADSLISARLSDASEIGRVPVGKGNLDELAYMVALKTAGYESPWILDVRGLAKGMEAARAARDELNG
jgi:sugar phosphate isomerase/epimerase